MSASKEVCAEAGDDTRDGEGDACAPGQTGTDNGPKELVGSKPSDVPANRRVPKTADYSSTWSRGTTLQRSDTRVREGQ
jgi:hypothetical protein